MATRKEKPIEFEEAEVIETTALAESPKNEVATTEDKSPMAMASQLLGQGVSIEQLNGILDLQERYEKREAEKAFHKSFASFKAEAIEIIKDAEVDYTHNGKRTHYHHATLGAWIKAVVPAMAKHGLSHYWESETTEKGSMSVSCVLCHADGYVRKFNPLVAQKDTSGGKNDIQGMCSTKSYLERYTFAAAVGLASSDGTDDDGQTAEETFDVEYITAEQEANIHALLNEISNGPKARDKNEKTFCTFYQVPSVDKLPAEDYDRAVTALEKRRDG